MNKLIFMISALLMLCFQKISAQSTPPVGDCGLTYFYDNAGNRILRMIVPCGGDASYKTNDTTNTVAGINTSPTDSNVIAKFQIVMITPNPTAGPISITCNEDLHDAIVAISGQTGQVVQQSIANGRSIQMDISHLVAGAYTVVVASNGALTAKTVIKMH